MPYCPQCGQPHSLGRLLCPECSAADAGEASARDGDSGVEHSSKTGGSRVAIARFQNGAEAGYFADELTRATGVEAEVMARERFDAVHAVWSVDYILLVDRPQAERSARTLQTLVEVTTDDDSEDMAEDPPATDLPAGMWVPLILTLAAGSIACFGIERLDHRPRPPALVVGDRREPPELWDVLTSRSGEWIQKLDNGSGVRRLRLDHDNHSARLEEDHDGDGHVDREWEFSWKKR